MNDCFTSLWTHNLLKQVMSAYERRYTKAEHNMHATVRPFVQVSHTLYEAVSIWHDTYCDAMLCTISSSVDSMYRALMYITCTQYASSSKCFDYTTCKCNGNLTISIATV
jgi:hypothetical protein